jgi:O-antigen ligase
MFSCIKDTLNEKRRIIIESKAFVKQYSQYGTALTYTNLVMATAASIFLPYLLAGSILIMAAMYILINKQTRQILILHKDATYVFVFLGFVQIVSAIHGNWYGMLAGFGFTLALILGIFWYQIMTKELFERTLTLICIFSMLGSIYAIFEKIIMIEFPGYYNYERVCSTFFYPNYFGTISATVILICVYKILTNKENRSLFLVIAIFNVLNIYLCESMFAWIEVFTGTALLLFLMKKYRILGYWMGLAFIGGFFILILNFDLIPRLSEAETTLNMRFKIWEKAIDLIKQAPLFGEGPMAFAFKTKQLGNRIPHSHNFILESILNYGIIGSMGILFFSVKYLYYVCKTCFKDKKSEITSLILAVIFAAFIHGLTDNTLMWIQTLPLFVFLLAGFGAFKKKEVIQVNEMIILPQLNKNLGLSYYTKSN